jgi:hypothetical protein
MDGVADRPRLLIESEASGQGAIRIYWQRYKDGIKVEPDGVGSKETKSVIGSTLNDTMSPAMPGTAQRALARRAGEQLVNSRRVRGAAKLFTHRRVAK